MTIRLATASDARRLATLHATRITEGFLPTLGTPFLTRLYRRIARSAGAFAVVADEGGKIVGFVAAAEDVGALYRSFLIRDGAVAGALAAPRLLRSLRRVIETLRYPSGETDLPRAEILSVVVDAAAGGRGLGTRLVTEALRMIGERGVRCAKVVVGAGNEPALALYERCGFAHRARIEVHEGTPSEVLVWTAP